MEWEKINYKLNLESVNLKAEELFKTYHDKVPFVKQLMDATMKRAQDSGKIRTLLGRLCQVSIYGNPINSGFIKHYHMIKRSWNTDQGSEEHIHTKH